MISFTETMYRLCNQCQAFVSIYAKEQRLCQIQDMEASGIFTIWVFHHDNDRSQHNHPYDEGLYKV